MKTDLSFYKGKTVFLTGHTGFKGTWMSVVLANAGAQVIGYSSCSKSEMRLFDICGIKDQVVHIKGDVRDVSHLYDVLRVWSPEIVIHMAAQPIVRQSYEDPILTYETNTMGTLYLLDAVRRIGSVRSLLNVTTDKVYENKEWEWGYRENDPLNGFDPYSNSKSCSELITSSYKHSFFADNSVAISTARAGNVIGGGDFAKDRIIPDCVRAATKRKKIVVRNPYSIRPYQHVLEAIMAYLLIIEEQYKDSHFAGNYNIGPNENDCIQTGMLVDLFVRLWGEGVQWQELYDGGPHEANFLKLDCSRIKTTFGWAPKWSVEMAVAKVVEWSKIWNEGRCVRECMDRQIDEYLSS